MDSVDPYPDEAPTVIRVIEVRRDLTDLLTASPEKLELLLETTHSRKNDSVPLDAFIDLARRLQTPQGLLLAETVMQKTVTAAPDTLDSVVARDLFATCLYLRPLVAGRESDSAAGRTDVPSSATRTRLAERSRAVGIRGADIAVAPEEPVMISGVAADPKATGLAIAAAVGSETVIGEKAAIASGSILTPALAALGPIQIPAIPASLVDKKTQLARSLLKRGLELAPLIDLDTVAAALRLQAAVATSYYFGNAAAATTLDRVQASSAAESLNVLGDENLVRNEPATLSSWRDAGSQDALRYLIGRIAKHAVVAAESPDLWRFDLTPLFELYSQGAFSPYLHLLTEGRDSAFLEDYLEQMAIRSVKAHLSAEVERDASRSAARARLYMLIIEDKLGSKRASAVLDLLRVTTGAQARGAPGGGLALLSDNIQIDDPEAVLSVLTKKEKELVESTYTNKIREWDAETNNKCPHVRLARRVRSAPTSQESMAALRELDKLLNIKTTDAWIVCKNCELRAICPHVRERVEMEASRAAYGEIRSRLMKYTMKVQNGENDYSYYCRICSERLAETIEEDRNADEGRFGALDSGLRTKIWATAMNAARFVRFPTPTDERQFANSVAAAVFTPILLAEENSAKKHRRVEAELVNADGEVTSPRVLLTIILFVYAYILDLTQTSSTLRGREVGFEKVKMGAKASAYAEQILKHIAETHRGLISQIEDVSAEYLAAQFTEAYRLVRGESTSGAPQTSPEEELACQVTTNDQIYRFAALMARIAGDLPVGRALGPAAMKREFETIIGMSLPNVIISARTNARDPALAPLYLRRTGVEVPAGGSLEYLVKDPRINLFAKLYLPRPPPKNELEEFAEFGGKLGGAALKRPKTHHTKEYQKESTTKHAPPTAAPKKSIAMKTRPLSATSVAERARYFEAYRLLAKYTNGVHSVEDYELYKKELEIYRACDKGLRAAQAYRAVKSFYDFRWTGSQRWRSVQLGLAALYDEEGRRHEWSVYIFATPTGELSIPGGRKEVSKARSEGKITPAMRLIDLACGVCHIRFSRREKDLDSAKVSRSVVATGEIRAFYEFYASRCPAGLVHEWVDGKCAKCGLTIAILENVSLGSAAARKYYDQYVGQFIEEKKAERSEPNNVNVAPPVEEDTTDADAEAVAWTKDYTLIVRAAALVNASPPLIEAIGQTDGREYADVGEGRNTPQPPTHSADPRIFAADAEVRMFLADYGQLRSAGELRKLPLGVAEVLDAANVPKHEIATMRLPEIGVGYYRQLAAMARKRSATDVYAFIVQSLCAMLLEVSEISGEHEWLRRLGVAFAKRELSLILRGQKLFAKPGPFNWAIFESADDGDEVAAEDQVGDVGEDIVIPDSAAEDNPYSGDALDYDPGELGPNDEPP